MIKNISFNLNEDCKLPLLEEEVYSFWTENQVLNSYLNLNKSSKKKFIFYDGPPGTNGQPHIGHMLQSSLKDLWTRYKTMKGYSVLNRMGWDTHGLPIELTTQKDLNLISKKEIEEYGIARFSDYCEKIVFKYQEDWVRNILRLGRFADFKNHYATLTNDYIQTVWWFIKNIWKRNLLYRSYRINPYCPRLGTSLSNQEINLGYQEVKDLSVYVKFPLKKEKNTFFIAWTTTPWSLIGNVALALGENIPYIKIQVQNEFYILSENSLNEFLNKKTISNYSIVQKYSSKDLEFTEYSPLWDFFKDQKEIYYSIIDSYVKDNQGTGIVHISLYGEDDYRIIKKYHLPKIQHVNFQGQFIENCGQYANRYFDEKDLDIEIKNDLKSKNYLLASEKIIHKYPFNYKTGTRLIYFLKKSWFIKTSSIKQEMIALNKKVNWYPNHIKEGRFGKWLENNIDWAISRERFWGTPLPLWECSNCQFILCIESIEELKKYSDQEINEDSNLHIPHIDKIKLKCPKCKNWMIREPEVIDCWLDAAMMPWGQFGYPHKKNSQEEFNTSYPADFICEGQDQTRGWFYGLLITGIFLKDQIPYKNVICTELVLDEKGQKMSKSKGNVINPEEIFNEFGADPLRWLFFRNPIGNSIRLSKNLLKESYKEIFIPLWNIYKFFFIYSRIDNYEYKNSVKIEKLTCSIDKWILSEIEYLNEEICNALDQYNAFSACDKILLFIDKLSNWYIRRNRNRFWNSDKIAFDILYEVLLKLVKILSPFLPFFSEYIYQELKRFHYQKDLTLSVHLCPFPEINQQHRNKEIEKEIEIIREIVTVVHALRNKHKIKIRQPLSDLIILCKKEDYQMIHNYKSLILEELNIKNIQYQNDDRNLVTYKLKPNLKILGQKLGKNIQSLFQFLDQITEKEIHIFLDKKELFFTLDSGEIIPIKNSELLISKQEKEGLKLEILNDFTFILNTNISKDLRLEGLSRELVNKIQMMRKAKKFDIIDKIDIFYQNSNENQDLNLTIQQFKNYIQTETLAKNIIKSENLKDLAFEIWQLNDEIEIKIKLEKIK